MTKKEQYLSNIFQQLEAFLKKDWPLNRWIENPCLRVYVRQSARALFYPASEEDITSLDIANIQVAAHFRKQGIFTDFVLNAHEVHSFDATYIESIKNPLVLQWCVKRGWRPHYHDLRFPANCFYLPKSLKCRKLIESEKDSHAFTAFP